MKQEKILVVDDKKDGQHICDYLRAQGVKSDWVTDCAGVRQYLTLHSVDLIVLDVVLPDGNGLALVKELRMQNRRLPIIMISAERKDEADRIVGLDLGADDYLVKPILLRELYAKIRAVIRRYSEFPSAETPAPVNARQEITYFGPYALNLTQRRLTRGHQEIKLTDAEFNLLKALLRNTYKTLTRDQLTDLLASHHHTEDRRTIDVRISRLRKRIEPDPEHPCYIRTVRKQGYLFTPDGELTAETKIGKKHRLQTPKKKRVLVIGSGGREHALAWKLAKSSQVKEVFVAPGNAGTAQEAKVTNVPIAANDLPGLVSFAKEKNIDFTLVGPEVPLVAGVVDTFQAAGLRCFGPTRSAAQLEGSKAFSKEFLQRHQIPTAAYGVFTDVAAAQTYIREQGAPIVIKADGLAAGKGVILAQTESEACQAVSNMLAGNAFGEAGHRVVIEEFLQGEEASFICMVDGKHILPMATSQDHKARDAGDTGPNTGGMGAYSPAPVVTAEIHQRIMREVIEPTVYGMEIEGHPYVGFLYAGVMITADGTPKVLEFNCRLGDPETQPIMLRLRSDLLELCEAALDKRLHRAQAEWDEQVALGVVLAAGGYPGVYEKGKVIDFPKKNFSHKYKIFHAGTAVQDEQIVSDGGRVLCACALGKSVQEAQQRAYDLVQQIHWEGMYFRPDIGYRALARGQVKSLEEPAPEAVDALYDLS